MSSARLLRGAQVRHISERLDALSATVAAAVPLPGKCTIIVVPAPGSAGASLLLLERGQPVISNAQSIVARRVGLLQPLQQAQLLASHTMMHTLR